MAKESAMWAIGMANLPFVINLKFSRAVEGKNILKLPRPTLRDQFLPAIRWTPRGPSFRFFSRIFGGAEASSVVPIRTLGVPEHPQSDTNTHPCIYVGTEWFPRIPLLTPMTLGASSVGKEVLPSTGFIHNKLWDSKILSKGHQDIRLCYVQMSTAMLSEFARSYLLRCLSFVSFHVLSIVRSFGGSGDLDLPLCWNIHNFSRGPFSRSPVLLILKD